MNDGAQQETAWAEVEGGVCAPRGFTAAGVPAGIKHPGGTRRDCALVLSDAPASLAGTFTTNLVKAPPIRWSQGVCIRGAGRAVFINSGNANACTGNQGLQDAQRTAEVIAIGRDIPITEVCVLSTGVIGVPLPMDRIEKGAEDAMAALAPGGWRDAAEAIITTDTVAKPYAIELPLSTGTVRIGGMAKGAGMVAPNMATMLAVLTTDATVQSDALDGLLKRCVQRTFNCICVDNDMSTSDALLCFANGRAGLPTLTPESEDFQRFAAGLEEVCLHLAQWLVRDGEGATKFVTIEVRGAVDDADAKRVARAIAQSQLCKTAFAGEDPNWGRIACAAGYSGADFLPERLWIALDDVEVLHEGLPTGHREEDAAAVMTRDAFTIRIRLGEGPGCCTFWTSDLSHGYVTINADYRT